MGTRFTAYNRKSRGKRGGGGQTMAGGSEAASPAMIPALNKGVLLSVTHLRARASMYNRNASALTMQTNRDNSSNSSGGSSRSCCRPVCQSFIYETTLRM